MSCPASNEVPENAQKHLGGNIGRARRVYGIESSEPGVRETVNGRISRGIPGSVLFLLL